MSAQTDEAGNDGSQSSAGLLETMERQRRVIYLRDKEVAELQAKLTEAERKLAMAENRAELFAEDIECLHMCLDDIDVPRADGEGRIYSMWGRVQIAFRSNAIKEIEGGKK